MSGFVSWVSRPGGLLFGSVPAPSVLLLAVALVLSGIGFFRFVYFISIGYGMSVFGIVVSALVVYRAHLDAWSLVQGALLAVYGVRLAVYLAARERQAGFTEAREAIAERAAGLSLVLKLGTWIAVALLYVVMCTPLLYRLAELASAAGGGAAHPGGGAPRSAFPPIGLVLCAIGIAAEATADRQKARFKRRDPSAFCTLGLYRVVRYPNYLGEILVWTGSWIAGIPCYADWGAWTLSLLGLALIVLIMLGAAKRLEEKQTARYGDQEAYRDYASSVPVLLPLVPLYSLRGLRVYLG